MSTNSFFQLDDDVAVITGGASGIGLETARRFLQVGAKVIIADMQDASAIAAELGARFIETDVTSEKQVKNLLQTTKTEFGRLDILVNNAGIFSDYKNLQETGEEDFDRCFSVNTKGVAWGMKYAAQFMSEGGRIINTASYAANNGVMALSSYVAAKHAVIGLTKTAALELAERKIRVNCICPSTVDTPMAHEGDGEFLLEAEKTMVPLARICQAEEAAALIHFLAARDCDFISGQAITLDGGMSAGISGRAFEKLSSN